VIKVVEPGALSSVQDVVGRPAWRHLGVPVGGAADPWSASLANRLVGNPDTAGLLEMTLHGATLRFESAAAVALTGRLEASVDGLPLAAARPTRLRSGCVVRIGSGTGARGYLAIAGGIAVDAVLGSVSTDLRSGYGGLNGRPLQAGDRLEIGAPSGSLRRSPNGRPAGQGPVRLVAGPHADSASLGELVERPWRVSDAADRTGVRLLERLDSGGEVASMGLPLGAIQLPPDGRPIIMLADRPVTGGYPVPAVVIRADIGRVAQLRPGDQVAFASISVEEAHEALRRVEDELAALEPLGEREDDELGWVGSHR
jgi:biotin-dependent carboxylase-like uncharacterized protein